MSVELISVLVAVLAIGATLAGLILTSNRGLRKDCSKDCARPSAGGSRPARDERSMNLCRYFLPLLVVLLLSGPLSAQETDEDGQFYLNFSGSAIFPYAPKVQSVGLGGPGNNFEVGGGFTAAFGYAFKEGFSTEIEWGHQRVGIGNKLPFGNLPQTNFGGLIWTGSESPSGFEIPSPPSITIESNGEIKTQSLMGNVYYRYPKWRVSPYAGFGLGAFFHDRTVTSTISFEPPPPPPRRILPRLSRRTPHSHIRGFSFFLSDHGRSLGSGLQARGVPLWLSLSLKPRGADRCRPN